MEEVVYLYLDDIIPNRFQPREVFEEQALKELALSIKEHGVIQPIIVRKVGDKYEIIAGERRYKASTMVGLTKIPAIVRNLDDQESSKVALIENLQRKDLTPIEEARTYQKILDITSLTQDELAKTVGKSQSSVANKLRLLTLPEPVQSALLKEKISERHARTLLNITSTKNQIDLLNKVIENKMPVRDLEIEVKKLQTENEDNRLKEIDNNIANTLNKILSKEPIDLETNETVLPKQEEKTENKDVELLDIDDKLPFINIDIQNEIEIKPSTKIQGAIKEVREKIEQLEKEGYKIIADELDLENTYQFIIEIDKKSE